jgi:hypothetical protein
MRHLRTIPILGLALTLGMLTVSAPFVDPTSAAAAGPRDKNKASKTKTRPGNAGAATSSASDPTRVAAGYRVRIAGATLRGVTASTLSDEVEVIEHRSGSDDRTITLTSGRGLLSEVTLTGTGAIPRVVLDQWRALEDGKPRKEDVAIEVLDAAGEVIYQHRLYSTLPRKLTTSPAKNKWTLTLAVERLDLYR